MRPFLIGFLAFLIWSSGATYWYLCKVQGVWCPGTETSSSAGEAGPKTDLGPPLPLLDEIGDTLALFPVNLGFAKGQSSPNLPPDSLLQGLADHLMLQLAQDSLGYLMISGLYDPEQEGDSLQSADVIGAERAVKLKAILTGLGLDPILIETEIGAESLTFGEDSLSWNAFELSFLRDPEELPLPESLQGVHRVFFSYAKPLLQEGPGTRNFIKEVGAWLAQAPGKQVLVVGYTDDTAAKGANYRLGMKRARVIAELLVAAGAAPEQILMESLGEADPIGNNNTREGRAKNRRVEIQIIQ